MLKNNYKEKTLTFLKKIADKKINIFLKLGHAQSGNNGPYLMDDTPVRNTAHWLIIYSYLYKEFKQNDYRDIASVFANYLYRVHADSQSGILKCFYTGKDLTNGVIGQAWVIEALVYYYSVFGEKKALTVSKKIFDAHFFDKKELCWQKMDFDGSQLGIDFAFNHELWFAASGCMILKHIQDDAIEQEISLFLDGCLKSNFKVHKDGLICHFGNKKERYLIDVLGSRRKYILHEIDSFFKKECKKYIFAKRRFIIPDKYDIDAYERAYHLFNLYAFAIIYEKFDSHPFFDSKKFISSVNYGRKIDVLNDYFNINNFLKKKDGQIRINSYAYPYNSPAFEFPYIYSIFGISNIEDISLSLLKLQFEVTLNEKEFILSKNTADAETLTASSYMLIRFLDRLR